jgi:transposase InsO family protein
LRVRRPLHRRAAHGPYGAARHDPRQGGETTIADKDANCPLDHVKRQFHPERRNPLWVSDFLCVAFVIDAHTLRIVGWKASRTAQAAFVPDALEHALYARRSAVTHGLVHKSDRGSHYLSIRYIERVADFEDNALAETVNGL